MALGLLDRLPLLRRRVLKSKRTAAPAWRCLAADKEKAANPVGLAAFAATLDRADTRSAPYLTV